MNIDTGALSRGLVRRDRRHVSRQPFSFAICLQWGSKRAECSSAQTGFGHAAPTDAAAFEQARLRDETLRRKDISTWHRTPVVAKVCCRIRRASLAWYAKQRDTCRIAGTKHANDRYIDDHSPAQPGHPATRDCEGFD